MSAPEKRDDRAGWKGVAEGLAAPQNGKGTVLDRCIDDDECLGAVIGVPEGHTFEPGDTGGRRDAPRARAYEPAGVRQRVILHVARYGTGSRVDRDHPAAVTAAARMRPMILVQGEIPEEYPLRPVARRIDDERAHEPLEIVGEIRRPLPARALGEIGVLVRVGVMHQRLCGDVPAIAVPRDPRDVARRRGIGEHLERRLVLVPVVVPIEDDRPNAAPGEQRAKVLPDEPGAGGWL